jgi:hypothetical protein
MCEHWYVRSGRARDIVRLVSEPPLSVRMGLCLEDILRERVPLFDGLDALLRLAAADPGLADDPDLGRLAGLLAEVEHLPVGAARAHWSAAALARSDRELMEYERRARASAHYACRRLQETLTRPV